MIVDWMVSHWGIETLNSGSGVIDVGGDPGFVAAALLARGVNVTVVDPTWRQTGKANPYSEVEWAEKSPDGPKFGFVRAMFDQEFMEKHKELAKGASVIVSLYGDEATLPCLEYAADNDKACAVVPCNECWRFFPPQNRTYEGYIQALLGQIRQKGGRLERVCLGPRTPFSRCLLVQAPPGKTNTCQQMSNGHGHEHHHNNCHHHHHGQQQMLMQFPALGQQFQLPNMPMQNGSKAHSLPNGTMANFAWQQPVQA